MRERVIALIGIVIVVLVLFTIFRPKPRPRTARPVRRPAVTEEIPKTEEKEPMPETKPARKEIREVAKVTPKPESLVAAPTTEEWGEDPFVRDFAYVAEMRDLKVSAITLSEREAYAIINNQIVQIGDFIAGKKVVDIEKDRVTVEKGERRFTIFLGE